MLLVEVLVTLALRDAVGSSLIDVASDAEAVWDCVREPLSVQESLAEKLLETELDSEVLHDSLVVTVVLFDTLTDVVSVTFDE